jgi:hypothetical protein
LGFKKWCPLGCGRTVEFTKYDSKTDMMKQKVWKCTYCHRSFTRAEIGKVNNIRPLIRQQKNYKKMKR